MNDDADPRPYALITGACGGIGGALVRCFRESGYRVIGTDLVEPGSSDRIDHFIAFDLARLSGEVDATAEFCEAVRSVVGNRGLSALINNAAMQVVRPLGELSIEDFRKTMEINVLAPFVLMQALHEDLVAGHGSVVNVSSIHARLTKPGFVAYATSKAALSGMTRAMGVEVGHEVRVNAISPAAIETPMLRAGFAGAPEGLRTLADLHPVRRIGRSDEVASLALFLVSGKAEFINGAVLELDGGIGSRLHDPV